MAMAAPAPGGSSPRKVRLFLATERKDSWWVAPLLTFLGFTSFIVYSTWAAMQNDYYTFQHYLSPMYEPLLWFDPRPVGAHTPDFKQLAEHAWFGPMPAW